MHLMNKADYNQLKENLLNGCNKHLISFVNPFSFYEMKLQPELTNQFDGFFSDGGLLCNLHNIFNKEKIDRVSFDYSSIADDFLTFCESEKLKSFNRWRYK